MLYFLRGERLQWMLFWPRESLLHPPHPLFHNMKLMTELALTRTWPDYANLGKMQQLADDMTHKWMPMLESLTSDPGCYMNEVCSKDYNLKLRVRDGTYRLLIY